MKNKRVFVMGTGIGRCIEEIANCILVEFDHTLAWVDLRAERVKLLV